MEQLAIYANDSECGRVYDSFKSGKWYYVFCHQPLQANQISIKSLTGTLHFCALQVYGISPNVDYGVIGPAK